MGSITIFLSLVALPLVLMTGSVQAAVSPEKKPVFYDREAETLKCKLLKDGCRLHELGASPENGADELCPENSTGIVSSTSYEKGWSVYCICDEGFKAAANERTCLAIRKHGESCELLNDGADDPCDTLLDQQCRKGTCQCVEGRIHDKLDGRCKLKVGQPCANSRDKTCPRFASCEGRPGRSRCGCMPGYKATENGTCAGSLGSDCVLNAHCRSDQGQGLVCLNGKCGCRHPRDHFYDVEAGQCVAAVGASCGGASALAFEPPACVPSSSCNTTSGTCTCDSGLMPAANGRSCYHLVPNYGDTCFALNSTHVRCDISRGFACIDGVCVCAEPSATYSTEVGACVVPFGRRCGRMEVEGTCLEGGTGCEYYNLRCGKDEFCDGEGRCNWHGAPVSFLSPGETPLAGGHRGDHDHMLRGTREGPPPRPRVN